MKSKKRIKVQHEKAIRKRHKMSNPGEQSNYAKKKQVRIESWWLGL